MNHDVQRIEAWCRSARRARQVAARATRAQKDHALGRCAELLRQRVLDVIDANQLDLAAAKNNGLSDAMLDRLRLDDERIEAMALACENVATLEDPIGSMCDLRQRPSGIIVGRMRVPLGTILAIYESRPNVTVDTAALCIKSGNAVLLRGGKEALQSNRVLASIVREALSDLDENIVQLVDDPDRDVLYALLKRQDDIDLVIPRGGEGLIRAVVEHSRIPVVQHYKGVCHVYVDAKADLTIAERIVLNAKTQRPGVCNAIEGVLVHAQIAGEFIPRVTATLRAAGVEIRGCVRTCALAPEALRARNDDYDMEFLGLVLAMKVVDDMDGALQFIVEHGSRHTESIVTQDHATAERFLREVDASCVLLNASTRFNDGGELGLGTEVGISTTKVHAYGPMGIEGLTCRKFIVYGHGEIRV